MFNSTNILDIHETSIFYFIDKNEESYSNDINMLSKSLDKPSVFNKNFKTQKLCLYLHSKVIQGQIYFY